MKKHLFTILIIIVIILIIGVSVFTFQNMSNDVKVNNKPIVSNTPTVDQIEDVYTGTNSIYRFETINSSNIDKETFYNDDTGEITIEGNNYKNINSIHNQNSDPISLVNSKYTNNEKIELKINKYDNEARETVFFDNEVELLPVALYLSSDVKYVFYPYDNSFYYLEVLKCNPEEERIVYNNGLTIYRNTGDVALDGNLIKGAISDDYSQNDYRNIFDCYFLYEPKDNLSIYKTIKIPNWNNTYSVVSYDGEVKTALIRLNNDETAEVCYLPIGLRGNVNNYNDLFYLDKDNLLLYTNDEFIILELNK